MRRMTVLATAGAVAVPLGMISFTLGRTFTVREPVANTTPVKALAPERVTSTIDSRPIPAQPSAPPEAFPRPTGPAAFRTPASANGAFVPSPACGNPDALGVSRVVEIDAAGGPGFGFEHFKQYDFLRDKEVVLTFDDGPWPVNTPNVLKALADECLKATFFEIGKHATWHPEITKQVIEASMTVGTTPGRIRIWRVILMRRTSNRPSRKSSWGIALCTWPQRAEPSLRSSASRTCSTRRNFSNI